MIFKFHSSDIDKAFKKVSEFAKKEGKYIIDIRRSREKRSLNQNAYYWGVVVKFISDHTGYSSNEAHQELAAMFLSYSHDNGKTFVKSTSDLNTAEFEQYAEQCRQWAWHDLNVHIPLPNEVTEDMYLMLQNLHQ